MSAEIKKISVVKERASTLREAIAVNVSPATGYQRTRNAALVRNN